jgi:hypothetical protein
MAYRSSRLSDGNLVGYVNWTLSVFPIDGYNATGTMPTDPQVFNLTFCQ